MKIIDRFGKKLLLDEIAYVLTGGQVIKCTVIGRQIDDFCLVRQIDESQMFYSVRQDRVVKIDNTDPRVTQFLLENL